MFGKKNKVQPIPQQPREITIIRKPWKKSIKWVILAIFLIGLGVVGWIMFSANLAIKKITDDGANKSSIFSFFDMQNSAIKGQSDGRTNILLLGMGGKNHPGGLLSDTMIIASINYKDKKLGLVSIPRDLWAPIPGFNHAKINQAFADGENNKKTTGGGGVLASKTVENIAGVPIHYYLQIDFEGFKKIVDMAGGIDVYVEKDIYDPYYPADNMIDYSPFKISAGYHHLDGATALKYARSRETTSDFDRSRRQEQVMSAVKDKILTLNILANPKKITELINILGDHVRTNMQVNEIYSIWNVSKDLDTANIVNKVLDTSSGGPLVSGQDSRGYYIYPRKGIDKFEEIQGIIKNLFNQTGETAGATSLRIEVLNGTNQRGVASAVAQLLTSYGYNVTRIADSPTKVPNSIVYDLENGKNETKAKEIANQIKASYSSKNMQSNVDIQVIVGKDYINAQ